MNKFKRVRKGGIKWMGGNTRKKRETTKMSTQIWLQRQWEEK